MGGFFGFLCFVAICFWLIPFLQGLNPDVRRRQYIPPPVNISEKYKMLIFMLAMGHSNMKITSNTGSSITIKGGSTQEGYKSITLQYPNGVYNCLRITIKQTAALTKGFNLSWEFTQDKNQTEIAQMITGTIHHYTMQS